MPYALLSILVIITAAILGWYGGNFSLQPARVPAVSVETDSGTRGTKDFAAEFPAPVVPIPPEIQNGPADGSLDQRRQLLSYLDRGAYDQAIEWYAIAYHRVDSDKQQDLRNILLAHASTAASEEVVRLLTPYQDLFIQDVESGLLLATALYTRKNYLAAIRALYNVHTNQHQYDAQQTTIVRVLEATHALLEDMQERMSEREIISFLENKSAQPDAPSSLRLSLAQIYQQQSRLDDAINLLEPVTSDSVIALPASALLAEIENEKMQLLSDRRGVTTALSPVGRNHYAVEAYVDDALALRLLIDTGASMTILKPAVINRITSAVRLSGEIKLNTANGPVQAAVYRIRNLTVADQTIPWLVVAAMDISGLDTVDGLLGMDYLKNFHFTFDQDQQILILNSFKP